MLSFKSVNSGVVCEKKKKRLEKINSLLKQIKYGEIPLDGVSTRNGINEYMGKQSNVMTKESQKKNKDGFYVTASDARNVIKTVKNKVECLNKIVRNDNDKTSR